MSRSRSAASLLRDLRRRQGKSLRSAADDLGVTAGYLSRLERGEKTASPDLVQRAAHYYDVDPDLLALGDGRVPEDVVAILQRKPDLLDELRRRFGSEQDTP